MAHDIAAAEQLVPLLQRATVVAIGPGLGRQAWGDACLQRTLDACMAAGRPVVVDADALNGIAEEPCHYDHWIMTPHPGEAARLLGTTTATVQADRLAAAAAIQRQYGGVCVLKGAGTIIQAASQIFLCNAANPGMASGGMGDVLTGIIAGLLAQGGAPATVAGLAACVHARAADIVAVEGQRGLLATDLLAPLRRLVNPEPPVVSNDG
jgi:NAD(P)H-hydrate epimerase